ncbi:MAG TPA: putative quinol monooxygenase [Hyphomicrobiaceae bacterium]|nr:putative quinol monooxygenase [Hyphomicrobiaceae bacterium]
MLAIIVHFEAKPDKIDAFKEAIVGHATRCLEREPGCLQFDVVQDPKNPAHFAVYEIYKDQAAVDAHRASPHMAETGKVIPDLVAKRELHLLNLVAGGKPKR